LDLQGNIAPRKRTKAPQSKGIGESVKFVLHPEYVSGGKRVAVCRPEGRAPYPYAIEVGEELVCLTHSGLGSLLVALQECVFGCSSYSVELAEYKQDRSNPEDLDNEKLIRKLVRAKAPENFVAELKRRLGVKF